jgi:hypothetical protein
MEQPGRSDNSPGALLRLALERDLDIAKLERMLELQGRYEATAARKAYVIAMSEFKRDDCPLIVKDRKVSFRNSKGHVVEYEHASLAQVVSRCVTALAKHGFHHEWAVDQSSGIRVTCKITHRQGHSETTTLSAAPDQSGTKNQIQAIASTVTYLERYTLLMALGLAPATDDDGRQAIAPAAKPEGRAEPPVDHDPEPGPRAARAIEVWGKVIGAQNARADMERYLGRPAGQWGDAEFERLLDVWHLAQGKEVEERNRILVDALTKGSS